jgi:hypothetical protein
MRLRPSSIDRIAARKAFAVFALCATVLVPMEVLGTATAGATGPTTSVLVPTTGATLSGTSATLDASVANSTSVEFLLFGGTYGYSAPVVCTATPTYYGWLCSWNTTDVPNGSYALVSEASGVGGNAFSSPISITVDNPPPSTTVVLVGENGTLDSAQTSVLDAVASPGVTQVTFVVTVLGETIPFTATPTIYGWIVILPVNQPCNPQTTPDCRTQSVSASIQSVASYSGGVAGTSPPLPATIIIYQLVG